LKPTLPDLGQWGTTPNAGPAVANGVDSLGNKIIPRHAAGGIFNGPSLGIIGEAGPEAVVPLDSFEDVAATLLELNDTMQEFLNKTSGGTGGFGLASGYSGGGSSQALTEYGHVPGDQPGGPTYDSDSWHGIGHIHGIPYNLNSPGPGGIAMHPEYASRMYPGLKPGGTFHSKKTGQDQRWLDTTGGGPNNEDRYHPPQTSVNYAPTYNISLIDGSGVKQMLTEHGDAFHRHLKSLQEESWGRQAVV
jgi:hypothetical protein